jgi:RNA polymerase sigma-70 factor (ECF subfamily)
MSDATTTHGDRGGASMAAIEGAYTERFPQFLRVAAAILGDAERGRDAVQEAFARAIDHRLDYRGDGPLDAWLWRLVTNVARDHRRMARRALLSADSPEPPPPNGGEPAILSDSMRKRIRRLPERQRLILFLRYYVDLSYAEIGEALEIHTGTVSATLNAAHNALLPALHAERVAETEVAVA